MANRVIVFVHGYMGSPRQFEALIQKLRGQDTVDMVDICRVVLPGHEATVDQFDSSKASDWQSAVDNALNTLRMQYDEIVLVGHSMGGLLLINSTAKCADNIYVVFTIALPLHIKLTVKGVAIRIRSATQSTYSKYAKTAKEMRGVSGITFMNLYRLLPNTLALLKIMNQARNILPTLAIPLIVINSSGDEIVSM